jgi:hypothetical protein
MGNTTWTDKAHWDTWTWTGADTATTPGQVDIAEGSLVAVGTSPAYQATAWAANGWRVFTLAGVRPTGTIYYLRFRTATTEAGISEATWSEYVNGVNADGSILFDLMTFCLNNPTFNVGPWIQLEVTLRAD